jgi:hypothetical protein
MDAELIGRHQVTGIQAELDPQAGSAEEAPQDDLLIAGSFHARAQAFTDEETVEDLEHSLGDRDLLFLQRYRGEPLVLMPYEIYSWLLNANGP